MATAQDTRSLGDTIHEARKRAGMSLRELAGRIGINHSYVSDIENDRRVPSERVLKALATQLGLDFDELMARAGRFGDKADRYIRRHHLLGTLVRRIAEMNLDDFALKKLINSAERLSKKTK
jgi:transcriptional regulator with XRE-family HTH domain